MSSSTHDLWLSALHRLQKEDLDQMVIGSGLRIDILINLQDLIEDARAKPSRNQWCFKRPGGNGEVIIVRDLFRKIAIWIERFKDIGDVAVQYDAGHAALPWAGVRFLLQLAVSDIKKYDFLVEGAETISYMIARYAVLEKMHLYTASNFADTKLLEEAILRLYTSILTYLARVKRFHEESTSKRVLKSIIDPLTRFQSLMTRMTNEQLEVDRCAQMVQAARTTNIGERLENASLNQHESHNKLLALLNTIDGPIARMPSQLVDVKDRLNKNKRLEILRWASSQPYVEFHEQIKKRALPGSGRWLLLSSVYVEWRRASSSSLLWLHGRPGTGKSTLTSIVIGDVLQEFRARQSTPPIYFHCSRNPAEPQRSKAAAILASLVRQLCSAQTTDSLPDTVVEKYEDRGQGFDSHGLTLEESSQLIHILSNAGEMTNIVIDALDECEADERLSLLDTIEDLLQNSTSLVKVFLSSRDDQDLVCTLRDYPNVSISSDNNAADIREYVRSQTQGLVKKRRLLRNSLAREELQGLIIERVSLEADGMFRWATLQLESLCSLKLDEDIRMRLGRLPPMLEQLYLEIYEKMVSESGEVGRSTIVNTLTWLLCAQTPMIPEVFCSAVAASSSHNIGQINQDHILDLCHNFVLFDDTLDVFRFSHLSVREFLERRAEYSPVQCHILACTACLTQFDCSTQPSLSQSPRGKTKVIECQVVSGFPAYATRYWVKHCLFIGEVTRRRNFGIASLLESFFLGTKEGVLSIESWIVSYRHSRRDDNTDRILEAATHQNTRLAKLFTFACGFGICEIVGKFLRDQDLDLCERRVGLSAAAHGSHKQVLKMILDSDGELAKEHDFKWRTMKFMTTEALTYSVTRNLRLSEHLLEVAGERQDENLTRVIFERLCRDVVSKDDLTNAASCGSYETFNMLLSRAGTIDIDEDILIGTAEGGNEHIMTLLLHRLGNPEPSSKVLEGAAREGRQEMVQLLITRGGKVTERITSLAAQCTGGITLGIILDHGGEINEVVMMEAAAHGSAPSLRVLLERGAQVTLQILSEAAQNKEVGPTTMTLLLDGYAMTIMGEQVAPILKQAVLNPRHSLGLLRILLERVEAAHITEDVLLSVMSNEYCGNDILKLFLDSGKSVDMTFEFFEIALQKLRVDNTMLRLLDNFASPEVMARLLESSAYNDHHGDSWVSLLLEKRSTSDAPGDLIKIAAENFFIAVELLQIIEARLGLLEVNVDLLQSTAEKGTPHAMSFLLHKVETSMITEDVLVAAAASSGSQKTEMLNLLLAKSPQLEVTEKILAAAARSRCFDLEDFKLLWERRGSATASQDIVSNAADNYEAAFEILSFLLVEGAIEKVSEAAMIHVVKNTDALKLYNLLANADVEMVITQEVLRASVGFHDPKGQILKFLLGEFDVDFISHDVFWAPAACGLLDVMKFITSWCGMDQPLLEQVALQSMCYASRVGKADWVVEDLARGVPPDIPDCIGRRSLAWSSFFGHAACVKALLDGGADVTLEDDDGHTALHLAAEKGRLEIIRLLLDAGAQILIRNALGDSPLSLAKTYGHLDIFRLLQREALTQTGQESLPLEWTRARYFVPLYIVGDTPNLL